MTCIQNGDKGERIVSSCLNEAFPKSRFFNDLIIPGFQGLTQVDHVMVCRAGVFAIETKHYQGEVTGAVDAPVWIQAFRSYRREFQNPLDQNARHITALRWLLDMGPAQIFSVVVFVGRGVLSAEVAPNVIATHAVGCPGLIRYLRQFTE